MRWPLALVVVVVASAGCRQLLGIEGGEVASDGAVDVPDGPPPDMTAGSDTSSLGHDEDGDGVPDASDNCPIIPNPSQVTSIPMEAVGDVCDPGAQPGDQIGVFFSFELPQRPPNLQGGQTFANDRATLTGGELSTANQFTATRASIVVANALLLGTGNAWVEIRTGLHTCRVGPCSNGGARCLLATGDGPTSQTEIPLDAAFRLDIDQPGDSLQCRVESASSNTVVSTVGMTVDTDRIRVRANGTSVEVASFIVYTGP